MLTAPSKGFWICLSGPPRSRYIAVLGIHLVFAYLNAYPNDGEYAEMRYLCRRRSIENTRCAQRMLASGAKGRKFESYRAHHLFNSLCTFASSSPTQFLPKMKVADNSIRAEVIAAHWTEPGCSAWQSSRSMLSTAARTASEISLM